MKKKSATSKVVAGLVIACAVIGGIFTISHIKIICTGKVGITYTYSSGVKDELLKPGAHFIPPMEYMKEFSTSNEILVLSKDSRDGSKEKRTEEGFQTDSCYEESWRRCNCCTCRDERISR